MASKVSVPSSENPIRMQSSLGGNVTYREIDSTIDNYGIYLAYVTAVYYQKGTLDFKTRTTTEALVNSGIQDGTGHAPIPVETFGTNENGYVYGNYRPIAVGDKIAIAYVEGNMKTPIVIGVYPKDSASYELLSPTSFNVPQDNSEITNDQLYSSKVIYPSQQVLYQSGSGDILKSLGGKSFLSIAKDDTNYTKSINYAYDAIMAFYEGANQLNPKQEKAQSWLLVHEDNPDTTNYDGHRTRFYVAPDGSIQVVLLNTQEDSQGILILEGSLDTGLTIKKQYDTNVITGAVDSNEYVSFNIGGTNPFTLTASGLVEGEVKKTDLVLKPDNLYINDKAISTFVGKDYDDDIKKLQDDYVALSKKLALVQDTANSASHGSSTAQQNSENANGKANDSNDENTWTPFKKAMLKQQIKILESEANSAIAYAEAVGMGHQDISDALKTLLNGTAALLTDMGKTETFSNATIQGWIVALKNAIDVFQKNVNSDLHKQIATTADGKNSISKGTEPPDNPIVGDIWFQVNADGTTNIKYYDNDGWYSPVDADVKAVEKEVSKIPKGYYQADEPQGDFKPNDIWYKVSTDSTTNQLVYTPYTRNADNTAWIPQRDTNSTQAVVGSQPASPIEGDFWTDTDNTLHQYKNGAWTVVPTQGDQGVPGAPGVDGKTYYTWIKYATDSKGSNMSDSPTGMTYIGIAYNKESATESSTATDYTWSLIKGDKGIPGTDGKTSYTHIAYANSADGSDGFYVGGGTNLLINTSSSSTNGYTMMQGASPGINGAYSRTDSYEQLTAPSSGEFFYRFMVPDNNNLYGLTPGETYTLSGSASHTTGELEFRWGYSTDGSSWHETLSDLGIPVSDGTVFTPFSHTFTIPVGATGVYFGLHNYDYTAGSLFRFKNMKLEKGSIATPWSPAPSEAHPIYMGTYTDFTQDDSNDYTKYTWALIKGADGKTSYLHIAYSNSADGSGCVTSPDINSSYNYIGTYTDYTSTSSTDPSSYKWVAMFDSTKKRNFTSQPTTPYSVGDTWTQSGATYFCTTARASGAFTVADWTMQQLTITSLASDVQTDLTNNVKTNKTYKGVTLNDAGLTATAGSTTVAMNSSDGFLIQKGTTQLLHADTAGNLTMAGNITAGNISGVNFIGDNLSLAGSLKVTGSILSGNGKVALSNTGVTIKGAGFNLGDSSGNTTVSMKDDGTFLANKAVLSGSLTSNAVTITGGDINMNGGKFHVDTQGNVTATSFTDTSRLDKGTIDFTNMTVDGLSANYIQTGILQGITLQGNTIIAGDSTITTQLDNNGFSQKSNDQFYNQVFNSEFLCSGQNWTMHPGVYVTNIAPTKDYSNRVAINPGTFTLEAGKWSNICDSLNIPINPNGKYSFSSIVGIANDTHINYDSITATLVWQDDNKKDLGHSDIYYDMNSRELQYLKKENITPIAGATHVMFQWNVHAPASTTGSGHIVFTQPYVTPYATCGVYRPGNVSSNNQINIKDGYIEFPIPDTYRSPSIVENASGYAGYDIVATGRGFLSAEGMFINAQVHKKDSSDVAGTNIYTESMSLSPTGMTLSIINNYKNSNNLVATIDPTKGIAHEFWTDNQVVRGSALSLQTLNLDGGTLTQYEDAKHGLDIYNSTGTHFSLANDGRPYCLSEHITNRTYSNSSNVYVSEAGALGRATSASKYKLAISDLYQASDKAHMFLAVKPKQWFDKEETEEFANDISGVGNYIDVPSVNTYAGFIAEDLEAAGLEEFVQRGIDGSLEGINYDRLPVLHHQLLREAYDRIDYLETQLYLLKKKVDSL